MPRIRLIPRLDIKGPNLIKGIHLEGLRVVGDPHAFAKKYYKDGADELLYIDIVASLYNRNNLEDIVRRTAQDLFIPLTVGGGVRSLDDAKSLLRAGADKIAINTAATRDPSLISQVARRFGTQCMVLSIEAKRTGACKWEAMINNGRDHTGLDVVAWAKHAERLGAGEILLTSIDQEGTRKGFDVDLVKAVAGSVTIPVIASGGMGAFGHLRDVALTGGADAVAIADCLHYARTTLEQIRRQAAESEIDIRPHNL
jgi:imidazole glycerol-phosphate synthase subunit HisF